MILYQTLTQNDFSISTVHSSDISNVGEENSESGTDENGKLSGLKMFWGD